TLATGVSTPPRERSGAEAAVLVEVRGQTLRFAVRESQVVRVELFNALGQRLSVLFEGEASVGRMHSLDVPAGLSSGVYLMRVSGRRFAETARVVVR
ncbi:MAG TPA: T9SS type A sorting domain-containing protein, partial [Rhodothermales bacterium]|nr:T9SS type A sorting domain-containing protein [Rhodothermales bacterium]